MRKFDLSLRSSRSSYFATFRHQLTILSKTDALDEEKWLNMLGTFVKDWFRYELIKERILVIILLLHFLSLMLGSVLVLMLPLLVWLTPDLRIKKSLLKCNWTIRKR